MFLSDFTDETLLKLSAFFHDIGKAFSEKKEGKYKNHDITGAQIFKNHISKELSLGKKATHFCFILIERHLSVSKLFFLKKSGNLQNKQLNFWWYENKDIAPYIFLLTVSDTIATSEDRELLSEIIQFIIFMQEYYFNVYKKEIIDTPLLSGKEIMEILNLKPSPQIKFIKEKLLKAQVEGIIKSKKQAKDFIKSML